MSGDEAVTRAEALYVEGRIGFAMMERWIEKGVKAGPRELPEAIIYLALSEGRLRAA